MNATAICITDDDILEEMKRKKEEKEAAEEEKELRKIEREKKKEEREKKKQERAKEKERKAKEKEQKAEGRCTRSMKHTDVAEAVGGLSLGEDNEDDEDDVACPSCGLGFKDDDSDRDWICCDSCNQWYCFDCSGKLKYHWRVNLIIVAIVFTNISFAVYKSLMLFTMFTDMTCITRKIIRRKF